MRIGIATAIALSLVSPAAAATPADKNADKKDPNRVICEKQAVPGSRLATKRICMTAAEWQAKRMEERQMIDKSQVQRSGPTGN